MNSLIIDSIINNMDNNTLRNILLSMKNDSLIEVAINMNRKDIAKSIIDNAPNYDFTEFNHNHIIKKIFEYDYELYCYTIDRFNENFMIINFLQDAYYMVSKDYLEPIFKNLQICQRMMKYIYDVIEDEIYGEKNIIGEYLLSSMYKYFPKEWTKFMDEPYDDYYNNDTNTQRLVRMISKSILSKIGINYDYVFKHIFTHQRVMRDVIFKNMIDNNMGHMISYFIPHKNTISLTRVYNIYNGIKPDPYCMMLIVKISIKYNKIIKSYEYNIPKKLII